MKMVWGEFCECDWVNVVIVYEGLNKVYMWCIFKGVFGEYIL